MAVYGNKIKTLAGLRKVALAQPGDPYVHALKGVINEDEREDVKLPAIKAQAVEYRPTKKRTLKELPAPVNVLNGIACVFMYTVIGLGDREIAEALKITLEQLRKIRAHTGYAECFEAVTSEFISVNSTMIQARLAAMAPTALENIFQIAQGAKHENVKLRANQDIMGRGGFDNKDQQGKAGMNRGDLRIVIVAKESEVDVHVNGEGL